MASPPFLTVPLLRLLTLCTSSLLLAAPASAAAAAAMSSASSPPPSPMRVAVFGGSGFVGKRFCRALVRSGCRVASVSRSGRPEPLPSEHRDFDEGDDKAATTAPPPSWMDRIEWLAADLSATDPPSVAALLGPIDAAVSCVGNVRPSPDWDGFWGLHWDDDAMMRENGDVNENIVAAAKEAGARRFVLVSVSYETAKAFEGPLPGYLGGKRAAELAAFKAFGDGALVVGPSLIYGGGRFAAAGRALEAALSSPIVLAYRSGGRALRSLSSSGEIEDWVEAAALTPPVDVDVAARAIAAGAVGSVDATDLAPRRQGFFDTEGKPVDMVPVPFVDMSEIRSVAASAGTDDALAAAVLVRRNSAADRERRLETTIESETADLLNRDAPSSIRAPSIPTKRKEAPFEGALVGSKPFLYPLPVAASLLLAFFWATNIDYSVPPPSV